MAKRPVIDPNLFAKTEGKPESAQADKPESEKKPKKKAATFYFDPSTLEALERVWLEAWLEARARGETVTKSAIVEAALLAWLERTG